MAYEPKELQGSLWRNEKKEMEKQPDHTGSIMIGGIVYRLSAWINEAKDGRRYFSLKATPPDEMRAAPQKRGSMKDELSDEIPF